MRSAESLIRKDCRFAFGLTTISISALLRAGNICFILFTGVERVNREDLKMRSGSVGGVG